MQSRALLIPRNLVAYKLTSLLVSLVLTGCSTIDLSKRPVDWPVLSQPPPIYADEDIVHIRCNNNKALACARIDFAKNECQIYLTYRLMDWILEHEQLHCLGYDHPNDSTLRDSWELFKKYTTIMPNL